MFTVTTKTYEDGLNPTELSSLARLSMYVCMYYGPPSQSLAATTVKKTALVCTVDDDDKVICFSFTWAGIA